MRIRFRQFALLLILSVAGFSQQKPLFDVSFDKSGNGKDSFEEIKNLISEKYYYDGISENDLY
ncbi:MAG: hypothetical protein GY816_06340 [Cytophagales bacterium]|nr:hypothetical protein [Cytophagales bacterium]